LCLFSWKTDSAHAAVEGVVLDESLSVSIDDDWPEANAPVESLRGEGTLATRNRGHLEALSSRRLSSSGNKLKKGKEAAHEGSSPGRAPCHASAYQQAPRQISIPRIKIVVAAPLMLRQERFY
jgi:hypothetical protein